MIYNLMAILCSIIIPAISIRKPIKRIINRESIKFVIKEHKYDFILYFIIVIGFLIRSICINLYPNGLNVDEASSGYEAFSILNYGIDRNGNSFPVFLEAWGSGQNALYTYIMIPFVKIMGLNIISTRLPMVIISCITLIVWYKLLEKIKDRKFAIIGLAIFVICPWHIMKSRWGLESNIFPDIILWAVFFLIKFLDSKKEIDFYIAFALFGITSYAYGTAYFFLPLFLVPLLIHLYVKKEIKLSRIFIGLAIVGIISLPIILYVLINSFNFNEFKIGPFTIPKLLMNRYEQQTNLFSGNILVNIYNNLYDSIKFLITQDDNLPWNSIPWFGTIYVFSVPFVTIGIVYGFSKKVDVKYNYIFKIWLFISLLLLLVLENPNINRINILIIPLIYYTVLGINFCKDINKKLFVIISIIYIINFIAFEMTYFSIKDNGIVFKTDIENTIKYINKVENINEIYLEDTFKEPYIYVLYYTNYNTLDFIKTVERNNINGTFENIKGFGKYNFYLPEQARKGNVIIVPKGKKLKYNMDYKEKITIEENDIYIY